MIKILFFFLFALALLGCKESRTVEKDKEILKARFVSYVEGAEKYPIIDKASGVSVRRMRRGRG